MELESVRGSTRLTYGSGGLSLRGFGSSGRVDGTDPDASVRALRPMSRRGSWGSEDSGWSAALGSGGASIGGSRRDVRVAPSWRTGRTSGLGDMYGEGEDVEDQGEAGPNGGEGGDEDEDEDGDDIDQDAEEGVEEDDPECAECANESESENTPTETDLPAEVFPLEPHQIALPISRSRSVSLT